MFKIAELETQYSYTNSRVIELAALKIFLVIILLKSGFLDRFYSLNFGYIYLIFDESLKKPLINPIDSLLDREIYLSVPLTLQSYLPVRCDRDRKHKFALHYESY